MIHMMLYLELCCVLVYCVYYVLVYIDLSCALFAISIHAFVMLQYSLLTCLRLLTKLSVCCCLELTVIQQFFDCFRQLVIVNFTEYLCEASVCLLYRYRSDIWQN